MLFRTLKHLVGHHIFTSLLRRGFDVCIHKDLQFPLLIHWQGFELFKDIAHAHDCPHLPRNTSSLNAFPSSRPFLTLTHTGATPHA